MRTIPLLALLLAGCDRVPDEVLLTGVVHAGPGAEAGLADATVRVFDKEGALHDHVTTDGSGAFEVLAPAGDAAYVEVDADGHVPASFLGVVGLAEVQPVESGTIFGFSEEARSEWHARYEGCGTLGRRGEVLGEVRVWNLLEPGTNIHPSVASANVSVIDRDGNTWPACYLDEEGERWDPEAVRTGASGTFYIGDVPAGEDHTLVVRFYMTDDQWLEEHYPLRVTEGGVAPQFPVWVEWPL